ncbi:MAG TPA: hypothetical protein PLV42_07755 [bacterium]|nr:hypothetical protein [bacterium]
MLKGFIARRMVEKTRSRRYEIAELEQKHVDTVRPFPDDSSRFYGGDQNGNAIITRIAFRGPGRPPEFWYDLRLNGKGHLHMSPGELPEGDDFRLGLMQYECLTPGKKWRLQCTGPLLSAKGMHQSKLDLLFEHRHPILDYADSSDKRLIAKAIAKRTWTPAFFRKLKDLEQTRYEQFGTLTGTLTLDNETIPLRLLAVRDRSFGSRDWRRWDSHYTLSGRTADGWCWSATAILYDFCGPLYAGFVVSPDGKIDAVLSCTSLDEIGEKDMWPEKGQIVLKTRAGKTHKLDFTRTGTFPYLMDESYIMKEGIGSYRFDGHPGEGLIEFGFNKTLYGDQIPV